MSTPPARRMLVWASLGLVLGLAAVLRLSGLHWDAHRREMPVSAAVGSPVRVLVEEQHLHPDERFLTMVTVAITWPSSWVGYFDAAASPLSPHNAGGPYFPYGTLPLFLTKSIADLVGQHDYHHVHIVGRVLSAAADLLTVVLTFALGRYLYGALAGLLGSLLYGLTALAIQQAHFYVVDTFATTFVMLALLAAVRAADHGWVRDHVLLGMAIGAGVACKASVALLLVLVVLVSFRCVREGRLTGLRIVTVVGTSLLSLATALMIFRLFQPYAFRGPGFLSLAPNLAWLDSMRQVIEITLGDRDVPFTRQWVDRTALWFPWMTMVLVGMGPALGVTAWAGWSAAGWALLGRHRRRLAYLIPWSWVLLVFLQQGTQWVKTLRYFLPIYPVLSIFAAYALVTLVRKARPSASSAPRAHRRLRVAGAALMVALVVVGTVAWAWAFTSVYRRPHSRLTASAWIYHHVPAGSTLATEHWDDALPLNLDGHDAGAVYRRVTLPLYQDDTPQKLDVILGALQQADYVILSSNRLLDSIPRLPRRYPMTTLYYRYLLSGELGFQRVAEFTSHPTILGLEIPDQGAEEAFSVYDHPRVQIFAKTARWSLERARSLLSQVDWDNIENVSARAAAGAKGGLRFAPDRLSTQRRVGTWSRALEPTTGLYDAGDVANQLPVLVWALVVMLLGAAAFPLTAVALGTFEDRGWMLSKTVGLVVVAVGSWALASAGVARFTPATCWVVMAAVALTSLGLVWHRRRDLHQLWRTRRWLLAKEELLFWTAFAAFLVIRWQNPDLWHPSRGGEKPMDVAYLNAVLKSDAFPPFDPWFAGGYINYYYFGFVLVAALVKLTGVVPAVAYNLAIPTFFALAVAGAFTATAALTQAITGGGRAAGRRIAGDAYLFAWGILGVLFVVVIGNLYEVRLVLQSLQRLSSLEFTTRIPLLLPAVRVLHGSLLALTRQQPIDLPHEWYWNATRVIPHPATEPGPITEFPFFTFLFADLHPHLMALPCTLLVLALVVHLVRQGGSGPIDVPEWATLGLLTITTGVLWPLNAWDFPTYLMLVAVGLVLREIGPDRAARGGALRAAGWRFLVVVATGRLLFHPFFAHFANAYSGVELWQGSRTPLSAFLAIHGLFVFVLFTYVVVALRAGPVPSRRARGATAVGLLLALLMVLTGWGVTALLMALGTLALALLVRPARSPAERLLGVLILTGAGLSVAVEHVVLTGDIGRMNTVFKSYLQIWLLWGVAAAVALPETLRLWPEGARASRLKAGWRGAVALLLAATCLYPLLATPSRIRDRFDPSLGPGLDGEVFMSRAIVGDQGTQFALRWDAEAMRWLRERVAGSPVVVEASVPPYRWGSRVSTYTGLPTVVGWDWHERQQRAALKTDPVGRRLEHVRAIYSAPDAVSILPTLQRYGAEYVYVGPIERLYYPPAGLQKFDADREHFRLVYANPAVRIFEVIAATTGRPAVVQHGAPLR